MAGGGRRRLAVTAYRKMTMVGQSAIMVVRWRGATMAGGKWLQGSGDGGGDDKVTIEGEKGEGRELQTRSGGSSD